MRHVAARREGAAGDTLTGARRPAGDAAQGALSREVGDGGEQLARVRVPGAGEEGLLGADLDQAAGVHDGDPIGEIGDHGQVVGHVEGAHAVGAGQLANGLEHVRLRGHVQRRGRLVEDDHLGPAGERHGDRHALLLAAGELMRVAAQEVAVAGQQHLGEHLRAPRLALCPGAAEVVRLEDLDELRADAQGRVERRRGVLRHVADEAAADAAQGAGAAP